MSGDSDHFTSQFDAADLPGDEPWIRSLRRRAIDEFASLGFPSQKSEEFRYTNVEPIAKAQFRIRTERSSLDRLPDCILKVSGPSAVFVDGHFSEGLSALADLPKGITVQSWRSVFRSGGGGLEGLLHDEGPSRNGFYALNAAFADDGVVIDVDDGVAFETPLRIIHLTTDASSSTVGNMRHVLRLGRTAQLDVVEEFHALTESSYFNNIVRRVHLGDNARLNIVEVAQEAESAFHISSTTGRLPRDSQLRHLGFTFSGALVRRESHAVLAGEGANATLGGVYLPGGDETHDQLTVVDHAVPRCTSNQLYKGVLDDRGRGVFNGKVIVREDAQQTLAYQQNRSLLLSDNATADTRPQLEIYADDVKCSHGATVGQLDAEALFYLRSRGIDPIDAGHLLMRAFVGEVVDWLPDSLRSAILEATIGALPGARS